MKPILKWALLVLAIAQFLMAGLPPGDADLISIQSLALDLSRGDSSDLYPGSGFSNNDDWVAHHTENLRQLGSRAEPNWCFYPPLVPFLVSPFASMGAENWRRVWGGIQILLVLGFVTLIYRLLSASGFAAKADPVWIAVLILGSYPVAQSVALGQTSLLLSVILWSAFLPGLQSKRYGSIAIGAAMFVKPFLLLVTVRDFMQRRLRQGITPIGVAAGLFLLSLIFVGWSAHIEYLKFLSTLAASQTAYAGNQSILAGLLRLFTSLPVLDYGFAQEPFFSLIAKFIGAGVIASAAYVQWRSSREVPIIFSVGLWISTALLALSISWEHHIVFLLPVLAALWITPLGKRDRDFLMAATLFLGIYWKPLYGDIGFGRVIACFPLFGNLILFSLLFKLHSPYPAAVPDPPSES